LDAKSSTIAIAASAAIAIAEVIIILKGPDGMVRFLSRGGCVEFSIFDNRSQPAPRVAQIAFPP
jgi:hypothetical protein